ncbi:MAG: DUF6029 family protein [Candidatus Cloacimonadota bacterium]|nr:DUF6029 family protein [Candidatus Cloacimonadota bacterium]
MRAKICLTTFFLSLLFLSGSLVASDFYISGVNQAEYIYRNAPDSTHQYFHDQFQFDLNYNSFRFGMKFEGNFPKYEKFSPLENITPSDISYEWTDRFLQYSQDEFMVRGGNFECVIGSGMIFHAYDDEVLDEDKQLDGLYARTSFNKWNFQAFCGVLPSKMDASKDEIVNGADLNISPLNSLSVGMAAISEKQFQDGTIYKYNIREVLSGRFEYSVELFDLRAEYGESKQYHNISGKIDYGSGLYTDLNIYAGKFTFTQAYKNYDDFDNRLSDLPTANYSSEPIAKYGNSSIPGKNEEGLQSVIRFVPNFDNEFVVNYAVGWSHDYDVRQCDFHTEFNHEFSSISLRTEYSQLERRWENQEGLANTWLRKSKPQITADFFLGELPALLKLGCEIEDEDIEHHLEKVNEKYYEPLFQFDISYKDYSTSIMVTHQVSELENLTKGTPKVGVEFSAKLWDSTEANLFVGKEKGGLVCRNGVCRNQAPFEGLRLELTTRF